MKKEWNENERWALAETLHGIIGADLSVEEEDAIYDAIRLISPEYAQEMDELAQECIADYEANKDRPLEEIEAEIMELIEKEKQKNESKPDGGEQPPMPDNVVKFKKPKS